MQLAEVIGTVVATRKYPGLEGYALQVVQPLNHLRRPNGKPHVAASVVQTGPGDLVFLVGSREAALAIEPPFVPVDSAIVGIVDRVDTRDGAVRGPGPEGRSR